jgi:type IV pilus assembly protein PilB
VTSTADYLLPIAVEHGLLAAAELDLVRLQVGPKPAPGVLARMVVAQGYLSEHRLAQLAAQVAVMPFLEAGQLQPAAEALARVPRRWAERHGILPLTVKGNTLQVAVSDPLDVTGRDTLAAATGMVLEPFGAAPTAITWGIAAAYRPGETEDARGRSAAAEAGANPRPAPRVTAVEEGGPTDAPVILLIERVLAAAVSRGASDVHWEPMRNRLRVRFRIDGALMEVEDPPHRLQPAILSRLKLMAHLSIAERRVPQDGRAQVAVAGQRVDLRVSVIPTVHGESVVMRLLRSEGLRVGLSTLGLEFADEAIFQRLLAMPDGMVLVTGPTGSGKTTTLYTCLQQLNRPDRKIITVEDPIEYRLSGINQVPVRPEIGLTFAAALRAMLRQAPNVIMLGEIRDGETADNAINAALTGHLVFSTLHTNEAAGAVTRLVDLGVKPFLVASAIRAVVAQRLVRRVCVACAEPMVPTEREQIMLGWTGDAVAKTALKRAVGCDECHGTGYRGRVGLFEVLVVDEAMQTLIHQQASTSVLREAARRGGMRTLREAGWRKVWAGETTLDEIVAATVEDPA